MQRQPSRPSPLITCVVLMSVALAACPTSDIKREVHVREQALLLPEAIGSAEPRADRIAILQASGRTLVFEDSVIGRLDDVLIVTGIGELARIPVRDARAIQLERELTGPDRAHLIAQDHEPPDVIVSPGWGIVIGVVGMLAAAIFAVAELGAESDR